MKSKILILLFCLSTYTFASCSHEVVDKNPKLACVTVSNKFDKTLVVTGYPGFYLKSDLSEETLLLGGMGGGLVQITPSPCSPYLEEKHLRCQFSIKAAKKKQILITYYKDSYEVNPIEYKNNCTVILGCG